MKTIDFTQRGGIPLTQDRFGYLQTAWNEGILSVMAAGIADSNVPVILTGMGSSFFGGSTTYAPGWFAYKGNLIRFAGGSLGVPSMGDVVLVTINDDASPLTYKDGSTPNVVHELLATVSLAATVTDATHFPWSALVPYWQQVGPMGKEAAFNVLAIGPTASGDGGVSGNFYYRKNFINNTLQVYGNLISANAQNFDATPGSSFKTMGNLGAAYRPVTVDGLFSAYNADLPLIKDDSGVDWIKEITCVITTAGDINFNWIKPALGVSSYNVIFNAIISLD